MKRKIYFIGIIVLSICFCWANNAFAKSEIEGPQLSFENERHELGKFSLSDMPEGNSFDLSIKFSNTGEQPLIINSVRACCGTRVKEWPQEPIIAGEEGIIKVSFRLAPRAQRINRTVTVNYNNEEQPSIVYRIVGEVLEDEASDENNFFQSDE